MVKLPELSVVSRAGHCARAARGDHPIAETSEAAMTQETRAWVCGIAEGKWSLGCTFRVSLEKQSPCRNQSRAICSKLVNELGLVGMASRWSIRRRRGNANTTGRLAEGSAPQRDSFGIELNGRRVSANFAPRDKGAPYRACPHPTHLGPSPPESSIQSSSRTIRAQRPLTVSDPLERTRYLRLGPANQPRLLFPRPSTAKPILVTQTSTCLGP